MSVVVLKHASSISTFGIPDQIPVYFSRQIPAQVETHGHKK